MEKSVYGFPEIVIAVITVVNKTNIETIYIILLSIGQTLKVHVKNIKKILTSLIKQAA